MLYLSLSTDIMLFLSLFYIVHMTHINIVLGTSRSCSIYCRAIRSTSACQRPAEKLAVRRRANVLLGVPTYCRETRSTSACQRTARHANVQPSNTQYVGVPTYCSACQRTANLNTSACRRAANQKTHRRADETPLKCRHVGVPT